MLTATRLSVKIGHFNALCEIYQPNHLPDGQCTFPKRCELIAEQIRRLDADVVCIQEANPASFYRRTFGDDYVMAFVSKSDHVRSSSRTASNVLVLRPLAHDQLLENTLDGDDGHFIMVRKNSGVEVIQFFHVPVFDSIGALDADLSPSLSRVARQNGLVAFCHHRATGREFAVFGSHLKANGFDPAANCSIPEDARRIVHLKQMLKYIHEFQEQRGHGAAGCPFIFCGDLNANLRDPSTNFLVEGRAAIDGRTHFAAKDSVHIRWASVVHESIARSMEESRRRGDERPLDEADFFTFLVSERNKCGWHAVLDYILYQPEAMAPVAFTTIPWRRRKHGGDSDEFEDVVSVGSPGGSGWGADAIPVVGSDHIPIAAEFIFVPPK